MMNRTDFLRKAAMGGLALPFLAGTKATILALVPATPPCNETPEGEEGPFPTHKPTDYVTQNIVADRAGTPLAIQIEVRSTTNNCLPLAGAMVDIWHCDHEGNYSEYGGQGGFGPPGRRGGRPGGPPSAGRQGGFGPPPGGGGMPAIADHTKAHFLRGRQVTGANGMVLFTSIFPGWYPGRAPHIHAHIFDETGRSLLICQLAFPDEIVKAVYAQGAYAAHGQSDRHNTTDHVFSGNLASQLASLTGTVADGFVLKHAIYVRA